MKAIGQQRCKFVGDVLPLVVLLNYLPCSPRLLEFEYKMTFGRFLLMIYLLKEKVKHERWRITRDGEGMSKNKNTKPA